jgi:hypothetical protein
MKKIFETIMVVVITLVTTLTLSTLLGYVAFRPKGAITIGTSIDFHGKLFCPIDVTNYTDDPLDGLLISIPRSTADAEILSSQPVLISDVPDTIGTSSARRLKLGGIAPPLHGERFDSSFRAERPHTDRNCQCQPITP